MPVEIVGRLRRHGGVYFAGETIECEISVTNVPGEPDEEPEKRRRVETIRWCSAQIYCQGVINQHRIKMPKKNESSLTQSDISSGSTSFMPTRGVNGHAAYSSKPTILFGDLELAPGETRTYYYREPLPSEDIPPSFKGLGIKYLYKLTIGVHHADHPVKLLRIPFSVLTLPGLSDVCLDDNNLSPSNPFLSAGQNRPSTIDIANELIETITAGKSQHTYNITSEHGKVCTLTVQKKAFKLGENIIGSFDFSNADVVCSQFMISLQTEEIIADEYLANKDQRALVSKHASQHGTCLFYKSCELRLQIPLSATPSFHNELVQVRWNLHFEFVISENVNGLSARHPDGGTEWMAPATVDIQTMVWDLPIKVFACNPLHVAGASCASDADAKSSSSLRI